MNSEIIPLIIFEIGAILILVKALGELFNRIDMPSIFGEILLGIILGPLLGVIIISSEPVQEYTGNIFKILAEIGAVFLLFSIGFDKIDSTKIMSKIRRAIPITVLGALFPFIGGFIVGYVFSPFLFPDNALRGSLLIGTALASTSISISIRTLIDLRYIATAAGTLIMITAVVDNFLSIGFFAVINGIIVNGVIAYSDVLNTIVLLALFSVIVYLCGRFVFPAVAKILDKMMVEEAIFGIIIGVLFIFAYLSSVCGLSMILGAFIFGASIARVPMIKSDAVVHRVRGVAYGFFIPFFFVYVGLMFDFGVIESAGLFAFCLLSALIVFQISGGFIGAKISKFSNIESLIIGTACIPRNEIALIIAAIGLTLNIYNNNVFSAFVLICIVTTVITPLILKILIKREHAK